MKIIRFVPQLQDRDKMLLGPVPAKNLIPDWYRNAETDFITKEGMRANGLKTCKPFLDVMISGYFLLIPFDIYVDFDENDNLKLSWDGPDEWSGFIGEREGKSGSTIPIPAGHRKNHLVWSSKWGWKTPKRWSSIVTHPFNRQDLPFRTMSGMIDSDRFFTNGNIPFHLKEDFVGKIEKGTPFAQIIPVKRSSWRSFSDYGLGLLGQAKANNVRVEGHGYKNIEWVRKEYN